MDHDAGRAPVPRPSSTDGRASRLTANEARRAGLQAYWARLRAEGRDGWTEERRARYRATMARKFPQSPVAIELRYSEEVAELRTAVDRLTERIVALEARPSQTQIVEWRPNHRRIAEGGQHVRDQRRAAGVA